MVDKVTGSVKSTQSFSFKPENLDSKLRNIEQLQEIEHIKDEQLQEPVTNERIKEVVQGMNEFLSHSKTHLKFEYHEKLKEYYVTIVDDTSKEIVKEVPAKRVLDMYAAMTEFVGLMVDKKV
ncbi:flagellar protein FlaG [Bacillus sp. SCS-153A]|uniref:flagellar protein FlaG n=1 Tax=Rossellomorea sedimentorum TaxID=3115294 RepID=UPI003906326A